MLPDGCFGVDQVLPHGLPTIEVSLAMTKYRIWLQETEMLPVEIEADSPAHAQQKVEEMLYKGTLWEENSIEIGEGCLEVNRVERV